MTANLWSFNTPALFWLCQPEVAEDHWQAAVRAAIPVLALSPQPDDLDHLLSLVLGEGQFGPDRWHLSQARRLYYTIKPLLPRPLIELLKYINSTSAKDAFSLGWPIERRYPEFQWEVMRQLLTITGRASMTFRSFWPEGWRFAFVLTHDIETGEGQALVPDIADLEEAIGFRSSFNFVPERYSLDTRLMCELNERGFEIGVHGLKHDGKLFNSRRKFMKRVESINRYLKEFGAVGFRAPLMHRNPEWMQSLEIEYDLSYFDTDPYEPMPGGSMSIWPYWIGHFLELPYTLTQDCTLGIVLGEKTPRLWLQKLEFIAEYHGMVLVNTHPEYLKNHTLMGIYGDFLRAVKERGGYWHAVPRDVARWWRARLSNDTEASTLGLTWGRIELNGADLSLQMDRQDR